MDEPLYEHDSPWFRVTVLDRGTGQPANLTGATFRSGIGRRNGATVAGEVFEADLANGVVEVTFPAGSARVPSVVAQLEVNLAGRWSTVWSEEIVVRSSLAPVV